MQTVRLVIKTAELTEEGILIRSIEVIDGVSGERLKVSKLNQELTDYLKMIEIDVTDYLAVTTMKKKNPAFTKMCQNFKLYT